MNIFTTASARGLFDYDLNERTRNNGAKLIVKHFNTSVAQTFYPIKITTTWNALPSLVVSSWTMNCFKNSLDKHWAAYPQNVRVLTFRNHRCRAAIQVCTNSRRPAFCWKWTQQSVLLLLRLLYYSLYTLKIVSITLTRLEFYRFQYECKLR